MKKSKALLMLSLAMSMTYTSTAAMMTPVFAEGEEAQANNQETTKPDVVISIGGKLVEPEDKNYPEIKEGSALRDAITYAQNNKNINVSVVVNKDVNWSNNNAISDLLEIPSNLKIDLTDHQFSVRGLIVSGSIANATIQSTSQTITVNGGTLNEVELSGKKVQLNTGTLANSTVTGYVEMNGGSSIDNSTITRRASGAAVTIQPTDDTASYTITNSKITANSGNGLEIVKNANVTVSGSTITGSTNGIATQSTPTPYTGVSLTVTNNSTIIGESVDGISNNPSSESASFTISNSSVEGKAMGIRMNEQDYAKKSTLNVTDSTVTGATGIELKKSDATISGSKTKVSGNPAIVIQENVSNGGTAGKLTIKGGTFNGQIGYYYNENTKITDEYDGQGPHEVVITVTGGTFKLNDDKANYNILSFTPNPEDAKMGTNGVLSVAGNTPSTPSQPSTPSKPPVNDGLYWSNGHLYSTWARNQWVGNYFFDGAGRAVQGWYGIGGYQYYFGSDYQRDTGWQKISGKQYYFDYLGRMATGEYSVSNKDYYFGSDGVMRTGVVKVSSGKIYDFGIDGAKVKTTGWRKINNKDYYFNYDYSAATGRTVINGKTYEFGSDGVLIKEVVAVKKNGLISENGRTYYYIDDAKQYGWKYLGTNVAPSTGWYFFGNNGAMATGWGKVDGKWYYFDANGKMLTGWNKIFYNGQMRWFYMSSNGDMKTGWQKINGTWYYLDENNGDMVTGWNKLPWDGKKAWFYFQEDGSMVKGWFYDVTDGNVYYMYSSGMMAAGVTQDGLKLDSAGKCLDVKGFFDSTLPYTSNIGC